MSIFQKSVIKTYLSGIDREQLEKAYQIFRKNYSYEKIEIIKKLKEEEYQDGFLRDIFVDVLGYTLKPEDNFNLVREFKNQSDSKKADGAILINNTAKAVIELKSTKTKDLKAVTGQAFNYKNNQPDCKYVIISNFQKLHFYIDYANEYEEFDLFRIIKEDLKEEFELLFLILSKDSILNDTPEKLKKESIFHEERVSKQLYADYSLFRKKLFENLTQNNPQVDTLTLFSKSQKLIDRFLFILFAEDKGLLPPNSINRIIERFNTLKEEDSYKPLYEIYKQYFGYMNIGRKGKRAIDDIPAYNGGLFYPDEVLYELKIDDHILIEDLQKLSAYDFDTDVDVNILGHIFEHSLSEIEETTAKIKGLDVDKTKSKRKKDGIFYTPQYITQYIVENTIGTLCNEKRRELDINEIEVDESFYTKKGELSKKGNALYQNLEDYKNWLLALKILDPACGSGAFLNQALSFLIKEHNFIIEIQTDLNKGQVSMFNVENTVLENNLYGVDINEESVEITKLSLWLRTAHKDRKLSHLSNNIRCGNSLIDDPEIAGDKAFNWDKEFSEIMRNGGFDVVIGNPPYVNGIILQQTMPLQREWLKKHYLNLIEKWDLYVAFIEKSLNLLKIDGYLSFIIPDAFLTEKYANKMRETIKSEFRINQVDYFPDIYIFEGVGVHNIILLIQNAKLKLPITKIKHLDLAGNILAKEINEIKNVFADFDHQDLNFEKDNFFNLGDIFFISVGLVLNADEKQCKGEFVKKDLLSDIQTEIHKRKIIEGGNVENYLVNGFIFVEWDTDRVPQKIRRATFPELYQPNKIVINKIGKIKVSFDDEGLVCDQTVRILLKWKQLKGIENKSINNGIKKFSNHKRERLEEISENYDYKFVIALINSKYIGYIFDNLRGKRSIDINPLVLRKISIPKISLERQQPFIEKADIMLTKNKELHELKADFFNFFKNELTPQKTSKKLENWNELDWQQLKKEMEKCKIKDLSLKERKEWQDYFIENKDKADKLKSIIDSTDREIDLMVYELYGLTQEEIEIVEGVKQ